MRSKERVDVAVVWLRGSILVVATAIEMVSERITAVIECLMRA